MAGGDEDVLAAALRRDEAETGAGRDEPAADEGRPRGEPEAAADLAHFAPGFELADRVEELGPVLALDVELGLERVEADPFGMFFEEGEDPVGCQGRSFQ